MPKQLRTQHEIMKDWSTDATPLVSICCITYNHEPYIADALDGFLMQQTDFPFEILIHDDASTDKTAAVIREYETKYPKLIKPIYQTENQYSKGARPGINNLKRVQAKYTAMCEGDDYWTDPLKLQKQVDFLEEHPEYVVTYHNAVIIDDEGKRISDSKLPEKYKKDFTAAELMRAPFLLIPAICFRTQAYIAPPLEIQYSKSGDRFLAARLGEHGHGKYMGDEISPSVYRKHAGGVYSSMERADQRFNNFNTFVAMYLYFLRVGKKDVALDILFNEVGRRLPEVYPDNNPYAKWAPRPSRVRRLKNRIARVLAGFRQTKGK